MQTRLSQLLRLGTSAECHVAGDLVFSLDRWGNHDQAVLVVRSATEPGPPRPLVDPVSRFGDSTAAIDWFHPSPDGRLVAYGASTGGDERSTLYVVETESVHHLDDVIPNTRAASVAWLPDSTAFAYTRQIESDKGPDETTDSRRRVWWHIVGTDWHEDRLIFDNLPDDSAWPEVSISKDGRWLLVHVALGWNRVDIHLLDRLTGSWTTLIENVEAISALAVIDNRLIGVTTLNADRGRVITASVFAGTCSEWSTIIPERESVIEAIAATQDSLLVLSTHIGVSRLEHFSFEDMNLEPIMCPDLGTIISMSADPDGDAAFISLTTFTEPATLYRWSRDSGHSVTNWSYLDDRDDLKPLSSLVVKQMTYPSRDGVDVPIFIIHANTTKPSSATPCILSAYGGFGVTMGPGFSPAITSTCERGGVYAIAGIRGGGEFGEEWHKAAVREKRQVSFDDFIAACEWLVANRFTSQERLAIRGGSNGGLLMAAAVTQRPDLCNAVQLAVPLTDMVRFHRFLIARLWIPEYGDPDRAEDFAWLYSYSPYHRVEDGVCYPAMLFTSAEGDTRVDPLHARKMVARLQNASTCTTSNPILLREETNAGHGQGKPTSAQSKELADALSFLFDRIGL